MKKYNVLIIGTIVLFLSTGCGRTYRNTGSGPASPVMTYDEALERSNTIQKIQDCIVDKVKYTSDTLPEHINQAARYTYDRGLGDCEDFAILAKAMLTRHGYDAYVMFIFPSGGGGGHAICVIDHDGYYTYLTNGRHVPAKRYSFEEVANIIYRPNYYYFWGD